MEPEQRRQFIPEAARLGSRAAFVRDECGPSDTTASAPGIPILLTRDRLGGASPIAQRDAIIKKAEVAVGTGGYSRAYPVTHVTPNLSLVELGRGIAIASHSPSGVLNFTR
jgi:hypothetical protein